MAKAGTKTHAIETVRFFKQAHPEWHPRLARLRSAYGRGYWWYCWTVMEKHDPMEREHELLDHIFN